MFDNLKLVILKLKLMRVLSYSLKNDESTLFEEDSIWESLDDIESLEDLNVWIEDFRVYVWGNQESFSKNIEFLSIEEETYYRNRIVDIMGLELFKTIGIDENLNEFLEECISNNFKEQSDKMISNFVENSDKRESIFLVSENNISVDESKVSRSIIFQIAKKICEEFSIRSISFSNNISDVDCFKYLLELAYSFQDFSNIIKSKNIGYNELSLSFEAMQEEDNATNYNLKFKHINFSINGYGAFSHEWFHFIDHRIGQKVCFLKEESLFTEIEIPKHRKKLFNLKLNISNKFNWKNFDVRSIYAMNSMLLYLPLLLNRIINKYNANQFFRKNLSELDLLIFDINRNNIDFKKNKENFKCWEKTFLSDISLYLKNNNINNLMKKEIADEINYVSNIVFDRYKYLSSPCWFILSKKEDDKNNINYFSNYSELMARSFELYILNKISKRNWVSYNENYGLFYPKGYEFEIENDWWDKNFPIFLSLAT
jgi:hypothetical protein